MYIKMAWLWTSTIENVEIYFVHACQFVFAFRPIGIIDFNTSMHTRHGMACQYFSALSTCIDIYIDSYLAYWSDREMQYGWDNLNMLSLQKNPMQYSIQCQIRKIHFQFSSVFFCSVLDVVAAAAAAVVSLKLNIESMRSILFGFKNFPLFLFYIFKCTFVS